MPSTTRKEAGELKPEILVKLIEQVQANAQQSEINTKMLVEQIAVNFTKSLERQAELFRQHKVDTIQNTGARELKAKVESLEKRLGSGSVVTGAHGVRTPRYKRVLHRGESIQSIAVRGRVDPLVEEAGSAFEKKYKQRLEKQLKLKDTPENMLKSIDGASAALRAVTAALIDRTGLDQTTRYLLTRKYVLLGEFLRVESDKSPALHETIAVMEAIFRKLVGLLHDDQHGGFYDYLVKAHGEKRGWMPTLRTTVAELLVERYKNQG